MDGRKQDGSVDACGECLNFDVGNKDDIIQSSLVEITVQEKLIEMKFVKGVLIKMISSFWIFLERR